MGGPYRQDALTAQAAAAGGTLASRRRARVLTSSPQVVLVLVAVGCAPVPVRTLGPGGDPSAPASKTATYRVLGHNCAPCDLKEWMDKTAPRDGIDCGESRLNAVSADGFACARKAAVDNRPFRFVYEVHGIDSEMLHAIAKTATATFEFSYDMTAAPAVAGRVPLGWAAGRVPPSRPSMRATPPSTRLGARNRGPSRHYARSETPGPRAWAYLGTWRSFDAQAAQIGTTNSAS